MFHSEIQNDHAAINAEEAAYKRIPGVAKVTEEDIQENYKRIKQDIEELISAELALLNVSNVKEDETDQPEDEAVPTQEKKRTIKNKQSTDQALSM